MDTNITQKDSYRDAIRSAALALHDCGYCRDDDPASVDSETEWAVARSMMDCYSAHGDESALCEFITEPGGFGSMMFMLRNGYKEDFYQKAQARASMYAARFILEAWDFLDSRDERGAA